MGVSVVPVGHLLTRDGPVGIGVVAVRTVRVMRVDPEDGAALLADLIEVAVHACATCIV